MNMYTSFFRTILYVLVLCPLFACGNSAGRKVPFEEGITARYNDLAAGMTITDTLSIHDPQPWGRWDAKSRILMGNAELALSLWGPPDRITSSVKKTDIWDRRYFPDPIITIEKYKADDFPKAPQEDFQNWGAGYPSYGSYDFPCPKPAGQIILMIPDMKGAQSPQVIQRYTDATVETSLVTIAGTHIGSIRSFVMSSENLYVMKVHADSLTQPVSVRLYKHRDTIEFGKSFTGHHRFYPEREESAPAAGFDYSKNVPFNGPIEPPTSGIDGRFFWIRQNLPLSTTLPEGFSYVMMGVVEGAESQLETVENKKGLGTLPYRGDETLESTRRQFGTDKKLIDEVWGLRPRYEPLRDATGAAATATIASGQAGEFTVYITVVTSLEAKDILGEARNILERAAKTGYPALLEEQRSWWRNWYDTFDESRMVFPDEERTKTLVSSCFYDGIATKPDAAKLDGDVSYARLEQDWAPWHADNHFNEPDLGLNHTDLFVANCPDCAELRRWYSIVEAFFPGAQLNAKQVYNCPGACYGMLYMPIAPIPVLHGHVKWEQSMHQSAQIVKLLWLKYEYTGDEMWLREHAYPIMRELAIFYAAYVKKENDGYYHLDPTVAAENRGPEKDTADGVTMVKYHLRATAKASEILGVDSDKRGQWLEIADAMPPYGTYNRAEGTVYVNSPGFKPMKNNFSTPLMPVILGDEIGLDSPPEVLEIARRTAETEDAWQGVVDAARKRLGVYRDGMGISPSNLIQSHTGHIRLFPAVPDDFEGGFRKFLAMGAFDVSAYCKDGTVTRFTIASRKGNPCSIVNPWHPGDVDITDTETGKRIDVKTDRVYRRFRTSAGHTYSITQRE